jgi:hypothetical protein
MIETSSFQVSTSSGRIFGVPVSQAVGDRDGTVGCDTENFDQLQKVAPVVFGVPPRRAGWAHAVLLGALGLSIGAIERDRRTVVVQLGDVDAITLDHAQRQLGEQAGPVGTEQLVEGTAHLVIVEGVGLPLVSQPEQGRFITLRPGVEAVEREAPEGQVGDEHPDGSGRTEPAAGVGFG